MANPVKVAQVADLAPGECKTIEVDGRSIALFNVNGTFYAIDNQCSHVGGPLGEGELIGEEVTCPWHGAQFNVTSGKMLSPPARSDVQCYRGKIAGADVQVELD